MTDEQIDRLKRGGHDIVKIHAAYAAAAQHSSQPTVILAHTKKGYGRGQAGHGKMTTHSQKKLDEAALIEFRNRFNLPLNSFIAAPVFLVSKEATTIVTRVASSPVIIRSNKWGEAFKPPSQPPQQAVQSND
jgi:pyruvate dehydrogenase complex dehydrogenase (E1) component